MDNDAVMQSEHDVCASKIMQKIAKTKRGYCEVLRAELCIAWNQLHRQCTSLESEQILFHRLKPSPLKYSSTSNLSSSVLAIKRFGRTAEVAAIRKAEQTLRKQATTTIRASMVVLVEDFGSREKRVYYGMKRVFLLIIFNIFGKQVKCSCNVTAWKWGSHFNPSSHCINSAICGLSHMVKQPSHGYPYISLK